MQIHINRLDVTTVTAALRDTCLVATSVDFLLEGDSLRTAAHLFLEHALLVEDIAIPWLIKRIFFFLFLSVILPINLVLSTSELLRWLILPIDNVATVVTAFDDLVVAAFLLLSFWL